MSSFAIAFLSSLAGGILAALLTAWLDGRYRAQVVSHGSDPIQVFPASLVLRTGALSMVGAWASLIICVASVIVASTGVYRGNGLLFGATLGLFIGLVVLYTSVAFVLRCPRCTRRIFSQGTTRPPYSEPVCGVEGWGAVVLRVVARGQFRCMHCGQRFAIHSPNPKRTQA